MGKHRLVFVLSVFPLAFAGTALGVPSAYASHADVSTCGSWSLGAGAQAGSSELRSIAFLSASKSWAVGDVLNPTSRVNRTLIERFDGSGWSVVNSPNQSGGNNGLNSVS